MDQRHISIAGGRVLNSSFSFSSVSDSGPPSRWTTIPRWNSSPIRIVCSQREGEKDIDKRFTSEFPHLLSVRL